MEIALLIGAFVISVISFVFSVYHFFAIRIRDRRRDTFNAYNILQGQSLDFLNKYSDEKIEEAVAGKEKEYEELSEYLARVEHFSTGVNEKIYDEKIVYECAHGYLDGKLWDKIQPLLDEKEKGRDENYYQNYCDLVKKMKKEAKKREKSK